MPDIKLDAEGERGLIITGKRLMPGPRADRCTICVERETWLARAEDV